MPKIEVETLSAVRRRLEIEVPAERVAAEMQRAYEQLRRRVRLPGFRPGRAPRPLLERQFGERVRRDVFSRLVHEALAEALREKRIETVGAPQIAVEQASAGGPLRFRATVEVMPEVQARDYIGLAVERPVRRITERDVEQALERLRQAAAQLRPVEGRNVVAPGDVVLLDYEIRRDGEVVDRGVARLYEVGSGGLPEAIEQRLLGAAAGQRLRFSLPEAGVQPRMEGQSETQCELWVRSLFIKEVPDLDDELAKDHGECGNLAELRERVRRGLEAEAAREGDDRLRAAILERLAALHDFEVPEGLVAQEAEALVEAVRRDWQWDRLALSPAQREAALERLRERARAEAHTRVKAFLVLDAIAAQEGIKVEESEVSREVERELAAAGHEPRDVWQRLEQPALRAAARRRLRRQRALELVARAATVIEREAAPSNVAGVGQTR